MRILRIFKLVRHFAGLQSLFYTLQQAYQVMGRNHFFCIGNQIYNHLVAGIGVVGPGGSCCHSHLLLPGLLFIQQQYIFMVFLISNFSLKSSYLLLLSSSHSSISHPFPSIFPLQVYFAERESQISLGDLNARNCTGWVEGLNKQNVVAAFNNQTISMVGPQTTAGGSGERT